MWDGHSITKDFAFSPFLNSLAGVQQVLAPGPTNRNNDFHSTTEQRYCISFWIQALLGSEQDLIILSVNGS